jgi:hypothetical protein
MKTSNKLLLSFIGLIILLMLLSDAVIWANYKNGKAGDGPLKEDIISNKLIPLKEFKVLKIDGIEHHRLSVFQSEKYEIEYWGDEKTPVRYSYNGDTLLMTVLEEWKCNLKCPVLNTVILSAANVNLNKFELPRLSIQADKGCKIEVIDMNIGRFDVQGKGGNELTIFRGESKIDSLQLKFGKGSVVKSFDVPYKYISMDVDSLKELQLTGQSLSGMKQIK